MGPVGGPLREKYCSNCVAMPTQGSHDRSLIHFIIHKPSAKNAAPSYRLSGHLSSTCLDPSVMARSLGKTHCSTASHLSPDTAWLVSILADSPLAWETEKLLQIPSWTQRGVLTQAFTSRNFR